MVDWYQAMPLYTAECHFDECRGAILSLPSTLLQLYISLNTLKRLSLQIVNANLLQTNLTRSTSGRNLIKLFTSVIYEFS